MGTWYNRRLERLERAHLDELADALEAGRWFFALPLPEQLGEIEAHTSLLHDNGFTDADLEDMRATLIQHYRPMD